MYCGISKGPLLLVHGGAGSQDPLGTDLADATVDVIALAQAAYAEMLKGGAPLAVVEHALRAMEDNPRFNAGYGSALQEDGQARVTASLMDGERQSFSAVLSLGYVRNPSVLARHLQSEDSRVVTYPGSELLARRLGLPVAELVTPKRRQNWLKKALAKDETVLSARSYDTVGCVVWDGKSLAAGTSTGGRGFEIPGRVSDSGTVAGNYASSFAAISATGVGEEIVDDALCARLETRVRDGMSLEDASARCLAEARARGREYGWIACDPSGAWLAAHTTPAMTFAVIGPGGVLASSLRKKASL